MYPGSPRPHFAFAVSYPVPTRSMPLPDGFDTYVESAVGSERNEGAVRPHFFKGAPTHLAHCVLSGADAYHAADRRCDCVLQAVQHCAARRGLLRAEGRSAGALLPEHLPLPLPSSSPTSFSFSCPSSTYSSAFSHPRPLPVLSEPPVLLLLPEPSRCSRMSTEHCKSPCFF
eukprot:3183375-Rhodomonas_salina.4